jgi:hypothetical protein
MPQLMDQVRCDESTVVSDVYKDRQNIKNTWIFR